MALAMSEQVTGRVGVLVCQGEVLNQYIVALI